jgi:surface protein
LPAEHPLGVRVRGMAQSMFSYASAFNQPLDAWDVGQLTTMAVRRRPGDGSWRGWGGGREAVLCHRSTHTLGVHVR